MARCESFVRRTHGSTIPRRACARDSAGVPTDLPTQSNVSQYHVSTPITSLTRPHRTRKSTVLPLEFPVRSASGQEVTSIPLPENTTVIISILAANHNKEIWGEDASDWRPERWLTSTGERVRLSDGENPPDGYVVVERSEEEDKVPGNRNGIKHPGVYASMSAPYTIFKHCADLILTQDDIPRWR